MADSKREEILNAALAVVAAALPDAEVARNSDAAETIAADGYASLDDGQPGAPEVLLSPVQYYWDHLAELTVAVQNEDQAARDAALDVMLQKVESGFLADPSLGGLADLAEVLEPEMETDAFEGSVTIKSAIVPIRLMYLTETRLNQ